MNFPLYTNDQLFINKQSFYFVVAGILYKHNTYTPAQPFWLRLADLVVTANGQILKDRGTVNKEAVTIAIRLHDLDLPAGNGIEVFELDDETLAGFTEANLQTSIKVANSVKAVYGV